MPESTQSSPTRGTRWILLAVAVGLALRIWEARESSLWLDELHTLFHASRPDLAAVVESVRKDFHVPGFYLFCHLCGDFSSGAWLRWIPILSTLATLLPLCALARESRGGERAAVAVAWLFALLPYQVHYGTELRPYAWLEPATALAAWAAFGERGSTRLRGAAFFFAVVVGMLSHVFMSIAVLAIGVGRLLLARGRRVSLPILIAVGAAAAAPAVPWALEFQRFAAEKREAYVEQVGERGVRPQLLREVRDVPVRLVQPYVGSLGEPWSSIALAGFVGFALAVAALAWLAWRSRRERAGRPRDPILLAILVYAAVHFAVVTALSIRSWDRVPLQYYVGMSWAIPFALAAWLAGVHADRVRRALALALVGSSLAMGVALAGGESREPYRDAVALARRWGTSLSEAFPDRPPVYTSVLAQPSGVFDHRLPYLAYAPDLGAVEPEQVPAPASPDFRRPVVVIRRALALEHPKWAPIATGRKIVREERLHDRVWVYVFAPSDP